MADERVQRRLAAILAADVVGYSRLMGEDEEGTLATLTAHRTELIEPCIAEHRGRVVKTTGDGLLAEFASAVDATKCAVAFQSEMRRRNLNVPPEKRLELRVGINLADVIVDLDDIHGDGVNVAARLEGLAEPGGIFVSGKVYDEVQTRIDLDCEDLGLHDVKNIARPVHVHRVRLDAPTTIETGQPRLMVKPSIVVLPFENMSGDPEQEYFSDGIAEDLITALSRIRWFYVVARNSAFAYKGTSFRVQQVAQELSVRYVLEGSVRKAGNRIRVTAQLVDAETGNHIWAERYDRDLDDIFALQDELTQKLVGAIEPELGKAERDRARLKRTENPDAWDLYQQGMWHCYRRSKEDLSRAEQLLREAIELDPELGQAYSGLAETITSSFIFGHTDFAPEPLSEAIALARRAVVIDNNDAVARTVLGRALVFRGEPDDAVRILEAAVELNPSFALARYVLGSALLYSGRTHEAIRQLETSIQLSPRDPYTCHFMARLAEAHLALSEFEAAIDWARNALQQPGVQYWCNSYLVSALGNLGRFDEASAAREELLRIKPDFTIKLAKTYWTQAGIPNSPYFDGLRQAGLPE